MQKYRSMSNAKCDKSFFLTTVGFIKTQRKCQITEMQNYHLPFVYGNQQGQRTSFVPLNSRVFLRNSEPLFWVITPCTFVSAKDSFYEMLVYADERTYCS